MSSSRLLLTLAALAALPWGGARARGADAFEPAAAAAGRSERSLPVPRPSPAEGDDGEEDSPEAALEAAGLLPAADANGVAPVFAGPDAVAVKRRAAPLDALLPLSPAEDLIARARLGANGRLEVKTAEGQRALTVDPVLQRQLSHVMASYQTPQAAVVVLEPSTGRVLAMAQHAEGQPELRGLAVRAAFPAASVFKLVTASALVRKGLGPTTQECYDGGLRRIARRDLQRAGGSCVSLASAMGHSTNVVFAKLTHQHLSPEELSHEASLLGFNAPLPFEVPVETSPAVVPAGAFAFAETGAGFGDVYLSPLHGAVLASVVANGGVWRDPHLLEPLPAPLAAPATPTEAPGVRTASAATAGLPTLGAGPALALVAALERPEPPAPVVEEVRRVMDPEHAAALAQMLEVTVTQGTARRVFAERGYQVAGAVGKTGTLADNKPFRDYSWFIGYAPKDDPKVAVAVVIVNDPNWRIRAPWLAREAMRLSLKRLEGVEGQVVSAAPKPVPAQVPAPLP